MEATPRDVLVVVVAALVYAFNQHDGDYSEAVKPADALNRASDFVTTVEHRYPEVIQTLTEK